MHMLNQDICWLSVGNRAERGKILYQKNIRKIMCRNIRQISKRYCAEISAKQYQTNIRKILCSNIRQISERYRAEISDKYQKDIVQIYQTNIMQK